MEKNFWLVKTAFHGGGLISKHSTIELAEKAQSKWNMGECKCGCSGIVSPDEFDNLDLAMNLSDPYALAQ